MLKELNMNTLQLSNIDIIALFNMLFVSPKCLLWHFFSFDLGCNTESYVVFVLSPCSPLIWKVLSLSWFFLTLAFQKSRGQLYWEMSLGLDLFACFLKIVFRLWIWAEEPVSDVLSVHQIRRHFVIICFVVWDTYFDYLVKLVFSRALHCQGTIFLPLAIYN